MQAELLDCLCVRARVRVVASVMVEAVEEGGMPDPFS